MGELVGVEGTPLLLLAVIGDRESGIVFRTGDIAGLIGGERRGDGGMPTGALPGDGSGELRDFND
jgi:hypothetical protein